MPRRSRPFTDDELLRLYQAAPHHTMPELAEMFDRAPNVLRVRLERMGRCARPIYRPWTVREVRILRERWADPRHTVAAIGAELGRPASQVIGYASYLGLRRDRTVRVRRVLAYVEAGQSDAEAALREGISREYVADLRRRHHGPAHTARTWTAEEEAWLVAQFSGAEPPDWAALAARLGRTYRAVRVRARLLRAPHARSWVRRTVSAEQRDQIQAWLLAGVSMAEIARRLQWPAASVGNLIRRCRLATLVPARRHQQRWSPAEDESLRVRVQAGIPAAHIAEDLGRTPDAVLKRRATLRAGARPAVTA